MIKKIGIIFLLLLALGKEAQIICFDENQIDTDFCCNKHNDLRFVVVIPSWNNSQWYKLNLDSVFEQTYSNFHVIYIDDESSDDTGNVVAQYSKENGYEDKITLICNEKRRGALANLYHAIHSCDDNAVIVTLDGDDWFKDEYVLERLYKIYSNDDIWMTYGSYENHPQGTRGVARQMPNWVVQHNAYREYGWAASHLRTFKAWLFKCIKLEDLLYEGEFFSVTWDMAMMFPMLEMAGVHCASIPDILYVYNQETPFNDYKQRFILQIHCDKVIRSKEKYCLLHEQPLKKNSNQAKASVVIFSQDRPECLLAFLESMKKIVGGLDAVFVVYKACNDDCAHAYEEIKRIFNEVSFLEGSDYVQWCEIVKSSCSDYVVLAHDALVIQDTIDLSTCICMLEKTYAYAFYLSLGMVPIEYAVLSQSQDIPSLIDLGDDIYAWQFCDGELMWREPQSLSMVLYRKADLINLLTKMRGVSFETLCTYWNSLHFNMNKIGLCYGKAPVLNNQYSELT